MDDKRRKGFDGEEFMKKYPLLNPDPPKEIQLYSRNSINNYSELIGQFLFFMMYFFSISTWVYQSQVSFKPLYIISLSVVGIFPILFEIFILLISEQDRKRDITEDKSMFGIIYNVTIFVLNLFLIFNLFSEEVFMYFYYGNIVVLLTFYLIQVDTSIERGRMRLISIGIFYIALTWFIVPIAIIRFNDHPFGMVIFVAFTLGIVFSAIGY